MLSLHRTLLIEEGRIIAALLKDIIAKRPLLIQSKKSQPAVELLHCRLAFLLALRILTQTDVASHTADLGTSCIPWMPD